MPCCCWSILKGVLGLCCHCWGFFLRAWSCPVLAGAAWKVPFGFLSCLGHLASPNHCMVSINWRNLTQLEVVLDQLACELMSTLSLPPFGPMLLGVQIHQVLLWWCLSLHHQVGGLVLGANQCLRDGDARGALGRGAWRGRRGRTIERPQR